MAITIQGAVGCRREQNKGFDLSGTDILDEAKSHIWNHIFQFRQVFT